MSTTLSTTHYTTLFVNNLTVIDFSFLCSQRGLVGESWIIDLYLSGDLNQQGMIFDFGHVKKQVKQVIDTLFDHKLLVPEHSPELLINSLKQTASGHSEQHLQFQFQSEQKAPIQQIIHHSPSVAICSLAVTEITPESVKPHIINAVKSILPSNVNQIDLIIRCEKTDQPYYHYSHGLQHHEGDCQRIAHGHRSRLEITINGQRHSSVEEAWCQQWRAIYIATSEHLKDPINPTIAESKEYVTLAYTSAQGYFEISLPHDMVHFMKKETTVEHISEHIAELISKQFPGKKIVVKAFEGVNKGAISTAFYTHEADRTISPKH